MYVEIERFVNEWKEIVLIFAPIFSTIFIWLGTVIKKYKKIKQEITQISNNYDKCIATRERLQKVLDCYNDLIVKTWDCNLRQNYIDYAITLRKQIELLNIRASILRQRRKYK